MTTKIAPYGSWVSPITAQSVAKTSIKIENIYVSPSVPKTKTQTQPTYHLESRPAEKGRNVLVLAEPAEDGKDGTVKIDVFGEGWDARTGVHEYGGGSVLVTSAYSGSDEGAKDVVWFSNVADGRVYRLIVGNASVKGGGRGEPIAITPENPNHRFADFTLYPSPSPSPSTSHPSILVCILEDHTPPSDTPSTVRNSLVAINTNGDGEMTYLVTGTADFYTSPRFAPGGGRMAWVQWSHPDMSWEGGEVWVADIEVDMGEKRGIKLNNARKVKGAYGEVAAAHPQWADNDTLLFVCDDGGYLNPWVASFSPSSVEASVSTRAILPHLVHESFGSPDWRLDDPPLAVLTPSTALFTAFRAGRSVLYVVDVHSGTYAEVRPCPYVYVHHIRRAGDREVIFLGEKVDQEKEVVLCTFSSSGFGGREVKAEYTTLQGGGTSVSASLISQPEPLTFEGSDGEGPIHIVFYAPTNPEFRAPEGEKPPCIVSVHGGPTGMATQGLNMVTQYFTSRGFAWVEVNYGGSSGYGRKYTDRLRGNWGIADVNDSIAAVRYLSSATFGRIDPTRVFITGQSAGGFTVLDALCAASGVFAAGTARYGISNLFTLATDTHKFESRYLEKLVGGTAEEIADVYRARSAVFNAHKITVPLLILQGSIDAVVPPAQAEEMIKVIRERGGRVEYRMFEGEGHGWRREETIVDAMETELAFYQDVINQIK